MKKCTKCGIKKQLTEFGKRAASKDGHRSSCKTCDAKYCAENKDRAKKRSADWYAKNKDKVKKRSADRYIKNKTKILEKQSEYRAQNKEKIKQKNVKYYAQNKEKIKQWHAKDYNHNKERYKQQGKDYRSKRSNKQPACVYQIENLTNNKTYIGQTTRGVLRWLDHLRNLRGNRHPNSKLQQDFNELEEGVFEWSIVKELPKNKETLLLEEAREIRRRVNNGEQLYNLTLTIEQLEMLKENQEKK